MFIYELDVVASIVTVLQLLIIVPSDKIFHSCESWIFQYISGTVKHVTLNHLTNESITELIFIKMDYNNILN